MNGERLRWRRRSVGMSQGELAAAAGVSRQLVAAVEASRNVPSVTAALGLAGALGCSVEELFGESGRDAEGACAPVLSGMREPRVGTPLAMATVAGRRVWAPLSEPSEAGFCLADAVWSQRGPRLLDGATLDGFVVAGCEPALGMAAAAAPGRGAGRLVVVHASSGRALEALVAGRVHAAVVHGPIGQLPEVPAGVVRWELARWPVGLAFSGEPPALSEVGAGRVPVAHRERQAASQQALYRALAVAGAGDRVTGPMASGHVAAAQAVVDGRAEAGVTTAAVATAMGLAFTAWEEHVVQLWVDRRFIEHPGMSTLLQVWCSPRVGAQLRRLGGYELAAAGQEVG